MRAVASKLPLTHSLTHPAPAPILPVGPPVHPEESPPAHMTALLALNPTLPSSRSRLPSAALPGSRLASLLQAPAPLAHRSLPGALPFVDRLAQARRLLTPLPAHCVLRHQHSSRTASCSFGPASFPALRLQQARTRRSPSSIQEPRDWSPGPYHRLHLLMPSIHMATTGSFATAHWDGAMFFNISYSGMAEHGGGLEPGTMSIFARCGDCTQ